MTIKGMEAGHMTGVLGTGLGLLAVIAFVSQLVFCCFFLVKAKLCSFLPLSVEPLKAGTGNMQILPVL